uniref:Membrane protein, putative n=1 Tax=Babesia bovis TaxID=5865 RepID=S6B5H6_BABBO|nr:membrane protein, putative [Babesia bovis]
MKYNFVLWQRVKKRGGPVPLLRNPVKGWLQLLIFLHLFLLILSCVTISFPYIYDLHCSILFNSMANIIASCVGSFVMAAYYTGIAAKDWGTETEWRVTKGITVSMVVVNIAVSAWGIYALTNASVKIYKALHNSLELEPECLQFKAALFYFAAFGVIFLHLIVAATCAVVAALLGKGIKRQLIDIRDMY